MFLVVEVGLVAGAIDVADRSLRRTRALPYMSTLVSWVRYKCKKPRLACLPRLYRPENHRQRVMYCPIKA